MKIASVADVHLGNHRRFGGGVTASLNERAWLSLETLRAAVEHPAASAADLFVVAGDLVDYARPEPQLLAEVQKIFAKRNVALLVGNHDQVSTDERDHALGPLAPVARIVSEPRLLFYPDAEVLCVPFRPGRAKDWLPETVRAMVRDERPGRASAPPDSRTRLLIIHLGVRDDQTPPWLRESPDAIDVDELVALMAECGIHHCVAGNWHTHREWTTDEGAHVVQHGALVPTGFDNPGIEGYGGLCVWETGKDRIAWHEIPGPRFVKTASVKEAKADVARARKRGHKVFLSISAPHEDLAEYASWLDREVASKDVVAGEVLPDQTIAREEARIAADAARSTTTLRDALDRYVANVPMPETTDRGSVLTRCRRYLGL